MIDKKTLLSNLKQDFEDSKNSKSLLNDKIVKYKKYYNGEPLGNEKEGKSKFVSKDIKKLLKWQLPIILEPFVNTTEIVKCEGTDAIGEQKAPIISKYLNLLYNKKFDKYNFIKKSIKLLQRETTVVVRTGWKFKTKNIIVDTPMGQIEQEVPIVNEPTQRICKLEDIFIDPTADNTNGFGSPDFIIYRYDTTISNLRENVPYFNKSSIEKIAQEKINDKLYSDTALGSQRNLEQIENGIDNDFISSDVSREKVTVYEYWGKYDINQDGIAEDIVCVWVNDTIIKLEDNPYPDNEIPFIICNFDPEPFEMYGESAIDDLIDNSHLKTLVYRGIIENLASANIGQKGIQKGALDSINMKRFIQGNNFEYNNNFNGEIWQATYNQLGSMPFEVMNMLDNENQMLSGVTAQAIGEHTGGMSATESSNLESATQRRMLDLVRNIAENLIRPLMKKWLAYSSEFVSQQEFAEMVGSNSQELQDLDLTKDYHYNMLVTTQGIDDKKAQQLAFLLQTSQQSQDPEISKMLYVKLLKLNKMFIEAKQLESYQPQPNPIQQQEQTLSLKQLEAQVQETIAKIEHLKADTQLKQSKSYETKTKGESTDLENIHKASGINHANDLEKIAVDKHLSNQAI